MLFRSMAMVQRMGGKAVEMFLDSRLVVGQVKGELEARDKRMQKYLSQVSHLQSEFESLNLLHIPRSGNTHVDSLTMLATSSARSLPQVILVEDLCKPTEVRREVVHIHQVRVGPSWMDPMVLFLKEDILPEEKSEANKVRRKALRFWLFKEPRTKNCTNAHFLGHIYSTYTLIHQNYSLRSCMKGFVEATQVADLYLTEPSRMAIGGQICRRNHRSM